MTAQSTRMTADEARARHTALRDRLIAAALDHVPFDGWSRKALERGAGDLGLGPADVLRAFPGGPADAADHFADWSDRRMLAELAKVDLDALKVRERVALGVRLRLEMNGPTAKPCAGCCRSWRCRRTRPWRRA